MPAESQGWEEGGSALVGVPIGDEISDCLLKGNGIGQRSGENERTDHEL